jgi:hypothetical protein
VYSYKISTIHSSTLLTFFIYVLQANGDADAIAESNDYNLTQPYMLKVGPSIYVVVEKQALNCGVDPWTAFDVWFKFFFVLNIKYEARLVAFCHFFEKYVYRIKGGRTYASCAKFYDKLTNKMN